MKTRSDWRTLDWQDHLLRWVPGWEGQNGRRTPLINCMLFSLYSVLECFQDILDAVLVIRAFTSKMYPRVGPSTATLNLIPCWITQISFGSTWNCSFGLAPSFDNARDTNMYNLLKCLLWCSENKELIQVVLTFLTQQIPRPWLRLRPSGYNQNQVQRVVGDLHPAELGGDVELALLRHDQHVPVAVVHCTILHAEETNIKSMKWKQVESYLELQAKIWIARPCLVLGEPAPATVRSPSTKSAF